jgi:hypothetical protein
LKYKTGLTDFLTKLEKEANEKSQFLKSIETTDKIIENLGDYLGAETRIAKENLNRALNISNKPIFRRSLQDFYIMWVYLLSFNLDFEINKEKITVLDSLLKEFRNTSNNSIDEKFILDFEMRLKGFYQ